MLNCPGRCVKGASCTEVKSQDKVLIIFSLSLPILISADLRLSHDSSF